MPSARQLGLVVLAGGLAVFAGVTAMRSTQAPAPVAPVAAPAVGMGESHDRPAMSADEERFAHALWKVHTTVRTEAVRMSFTGMAYKTGEIPKEAVRERIAPLTKIFDTAIADVRALPAPASMEATRGTYLEALQRYRDASVEMVRVADDGKDEHLLAAHDKSSRASTQLLEVSETLWPGEYKPN
jgi:hypothetical protein